MALQHQFISSHPFRIKGLQQTVTSRLNKLTPFPEGETERNVDDSLYYDVINLDARQLHDRA